MKDEVKKNLRKNWRSNWLSSIFEFSHLEYQKGLWINRKYTNEIWWFDEDICRYFDDSNLDDNYESQLKEKFISEVEFNSVKEFHSSFLICIDEEKYQGKVMSDFERINDNEWIAIVKLGHSTWNTLKSNISDKDEINYVIGLEKKDNNSK